MRDELIVILQDMGRTVFTNEEKADYLLQHDVVPVVRCGECRWGKPYKSESGVDMVDCAVSMGLFAPDEFCSCGEREDDILGDS